jgi:RHS repeat-associated protein
MLRCWKSTKCNSNGLTNTLSYDSDGRLTGIAVPGIESLSLGYDQSDRLVSRTDGIDPSQSEAFDYDDQSRLTGVYGGSDTESYSYDADGNRLSQTINGTSASFSYSGSSNRLTGISGAVAMSYGYDAQGSTTTENGTATYGYDPFNRLGSAGSATDYVSPEGQRLRKQTSSGTTYFAPDSGGTLWAENDNGTWVDYVWLNGRLIGRIAGSTVDAIHADQTGRPQVVTDASQAVVWKATNYPFEREVAQDDIGGLNLGFPGQYYDVERGLWNNGFRDYNASLGRYVESDPTGLGGGVNTYVYAEGYPLGYADPLGLHVTIVISDRTMSSTHRSVAGKINVTSDRVTDSFEGYTMENSHAGDDGNKPPVPQGTYDGMLRTDHTPTRIELQNVPGYHNIQIHNGSYPRNFKGCFGAGTTHSTDFLGGTVNAVNKIDQIIQRDGSGNITIVVGPVH